MKRSAPMTRAGHDRWLVPYADLMTLLLAFFATLYAASNADAVAATAPPSAPEEALVAGDPQVAHGQPLLAPRVEVMPRRHALDDLRVTLDAALASAVEDHRVDVTQDSRGLVVSMPDDAAFPVATADVSPAALALIGRVAAAVRLLPNAIRIEGHTDDVPIRTARFESNWELSTARASAVVAHLIIEQGIEPHRLSAAGYGEFHPRVGNDTAENRARNRRIDIVILEASPASAAPTASSSIGLGTTPEADNTPAVIQPAEGL